MTIEHGEIPADMVAKAAEFRTTLIETLADCDDILAEKYLEGEEPTADELHGATRFV